MTVCCVFSLESPQCDGMLCVLIRIASLRTHNIPFFNIKKKITLIIPDLQPRDFFLRTQARVQNNHGKRAISVRAIEVLLYIDLLEEQFDRGLS